MNTIREIEKINQEELDRGIAGTSASWHAQYANSAWVYVGNLDHELTEGDVICVMSQYGEIEDLHLVREEDTGKSRGFAFVKYEDSRSCVLAVDNFVGVKVCGRSLRVDHVEKYRLPKKLLEQVEQTEARALGAGHAYQNVELSNQYSMGKGQDLFAKPASDDQEKESDQDTDKHARRKDRKRRRKEKEARHRRREEREERRRKERAKRYHQDDEHRSGREKKRRRHHKEKRRDRAERPKRSYSSSSPDVGHQEASASR